MGNSDRLDPDVRGLVGLSAALAAADAGARREALRVAGRHASRAEVEEVLLQAHLFVGFPIVLNAFGVWREMTAEGAGSSRGDAAAPPGGDGAHDSAAAGEALCRAVYGRSYERLRRNLGRLHPALDRWIVEDGYCRTLSRPGLSVETRELCIVALLAAGGHEAQLRAHLRGALNVGAAAEHVEAALGIGIETARAAGGRGAEPDRLWKMWAEAGSRVEKRSCSST